MMNIDFNEKPHTEPAPAIKKPKKQVSLSWVFTLLIVLIPLIITFTTISYFLWFQKSDGYVHTYNYYVRAAEGITIVEIASERDSVNIGDTIAVVVSNSLGQWQIRNSYSNDMNNPLTPEVVEQYKRVMKSANNARVHTQRKFSHLSKKVNHKFVTRQEVQELYQVWQENEIIYSKAKLDYLVALFRLNKTTKNYTSGVSINDEGKYAIISPVKGRLAKVLIKKDEYVSNGEVVMIIYTDKNPEITVTVKNESIREYRLSEYCDIYLPDGEIAQGIIERYTQADTTGYVNVHVNPINPIPPKWRIYGLPVQLWCD